MLRWIVDINIFCVCGSLYIYWMRILMRYWLWEFWYVLFLEIYLTYVYCGFLNFNDIMSEKGVGLFFFSIMKNLIYFIVYEVFIYIFV